MAEKIERTEDCCGTSGSNVTGQGEAESLFVNEAMLDAIERNPGASLQKRDLSDDCSTLVAANQGLETVSAEIEALLGDLGAGWTVEADSCHRPLALHP